MYIYIYIYICNFKAVQRSIVKFQAWIDGHQHVLCVVFSVVCYVIYFAAVSSFCLVLFICTCCSANIKQNRQNANKH